MTSALGRAGTTGKWRAIRRRVLARDHHRCVRCGQDGNQVDHIIPRKRGGDDDLDNLQTLCVECHKRKSSAEAQRGGHRVSETGSHGDPPSFLARTSPTQCPSGSPSPGRSGSRAFPPPDAEEAL